MALDQRPRWGRADALASQEAAQVTNQDPVDEETSSADQAGSLP
jgi:hypothetical protein